MVLTPAQATQCENEGAEAASKLDLLKVNELKLMTKLCPYPIPSEASYRWTMGFIAHCGGIYRVILIERGIKEKC